MRLGMSLNEINDLKTHIINFIALHPGCRKREIAASIPIWQCAFEFLASMDDLQEDGRITAVPFRDPAQMEFYDKWYVSN